MSLFSDNEKDAGISMAERRQSAFSGDMRAGLETQNLALKEKILVTDQAI